MNWRNIFRLHRDRDKKQTSPAIPPDPALLFPHPGNAELFAWMKQDARVANLDKNPVYTREGYEVRTHPELCSVLYELVPDNSAKKDWAYGLPVIASANGLIFAFATGTRNLLFRLPNHQFDQARTDGGRFDPTYGQNWISFTIGQPVGVSMPWNEAARRWAGIALNEALSG